MCFDVAAEIAGMCKACLAHNADVRLLASVSAHVNCKNIRSTAFVRAHFTFEWLLASVSAYVRPKIACLSEC